MLEIHFGIHHLETEAFVQIFNRVCLDLGIDSEIKLESNRDNWYDWGHSYELNGVSSMRIEPVHFRVRTNVPMEIIEFITMTFPAFLMPKGSAELKGVRIMVTDGAKGFTDLSGWKTEYPEFRR